MMNPDLIRDSVIGSGPWKALLNRLQRCEDWIDNFKSRLGELEQSHANIARDLGLEDAVDGTHKEETKQSREGKRRKGAQDPSRPKNTRS